MSRRVTEGARDLESAPAALPQAGDGAAGWPLELGAFEPVASRVTSPPVAVVHYGLGPIGVAIARLVADRTGLTSVGAVDVAPQLAGCGLAEVLGVDRDPGGPRVAPALKDAEGLGPADLVVHSTGSSLAQVGPQLLECAVAGLSVVSTCEELSYPWLRAPEIARRLDAVAREHKVTILGTGVNPGFAMDYLPVVLAGAMGHVERVHVLRVQDAGRRRLPLQQKVGAGLDVATFRRQCLAGSIRHVGLSESVHALAAAFGWSLDDQRETIEPVIAEEPLSSSVGDIPAGHVAGLRQSAAGYVGGREVVSLVLEMAVGLPEPRDEVVLEGNGEMRMVIPDGLHGDRSTAAVVVNAIPQVLAARAGLVTMADLPPPRPGP